MGNDRKMASRGEECRLAMFYVPSSEALRFDRQVAHGERGKAQRALFLLMMKATETQRGIWATLMNNPDKLEIRRKP